MLEGKQYCPIRGAASSIYRGDKRTARALFVGVLSYDNVDDDAVQALTIFAHAKPMKQAVPPWQQKHHKK